jgi:hypothetical protein
VLSVSARTFFATNGLSLFPTYRAIHLRYCIRVLQDPYFMRNHLGSYECKLCLTLHTNPGSYVQTISDAANLLLYLPIHFHTG